VTNDPELEALFADPAEREVVDLLKASRPAAPPLDPHFGNYLRAKLMTEARRSLQPREARPWFPFSLKPKVLAPMMAAVAVGFLVVLGIEVYLQNQPTQKLEAVRTQLKSSKTNVATAEPIVIAFTGPVDKNAVADTVVIEPATSVTKRWVGQNLVITPDHPLAPNTTYSVSLKPASTPQVVKPNATPAPTAAPSPVVLRFTTVPAAVPPVVPPSFKSANVSYGHDSRLVDAGTAYSASWAPAGQLLVTRPAGQSGAGSSTSPSATATPAASALTATTDVWLMSTLGTPIRIVAPGGSFAAAAPSGGLFAAWHAAAGNQANLEVWDLQGNFQSAVATIAGVPDRPAVWLGSDRLAYLDNGILRVTSLHGLVDAPKLKVDRGSLAASISGQYLAAETATQSVVIDLTAGSATTPRRLPDGAAGFAWSARGDLAFVTQQASGSDLWVGSGTVAAVRVASSPSGQTWSDLNWSPDATSLMLASKPVGGASSASRLMLINADGSALTPFAHQQEYSSPQWSRQGDVVLFTRQDEAGGRAFWTATTAPSDLDAAEKQALAEVDKFMLARIHGDAATAQGELDPAGLSAYQGGASALLSGPGTQFDRYYPVTVLQAGTNPTKFLVGVRIFLSQGGAQRSFFEEQLTLVLQGQRYMVDAVKSTATRAVSTGPSVVSVQVVPGSPTDQVRVRFDADLLAGTVTTDTIKVTDAAGKPVEALISFDPDNHLATLSLKLRDGAAYQLAVTTGVTDINGMTLAQEYDAPLVISR
jgi:Bacterial Ig-like domain